MFGLLLRADQETTKRAIIFGMRGVAGLARNALGDGQEPWRQDETEEVCGSATPKVVSAWSYDGGGGATTPLMLSHPLSRRFTVSIYVCLHTFFSIFLFLFEQLASFLLSRSESGIVLVENFVVDDTFHVRRLLYFSDKIRKRNATLGCETILVLWVGRYKTVNQISTEDYILIYSQHLEKQKSFNPVR